MVAVLKVIPSEFVYPVILGSALIFFCFQLVKVNNENKVRLDKALESYVAFNAVMITYIPSLKEEISSIDKKILGIEATVNHNFQNLGKKTEGYDVHHDAELGRGNRIEENLNQIKKNQKDILDSIKEVREKQDLHLIHHSKN